MTSARPRVLLTGGSGRLGRELQSLMAPLVAPGRAEMDITEPDAIRAALEAHQPDVLVHAAAFTDVSRAETDRRACWDVNVEGTRNVVRALAGRDVHLVHISTDYVFEGTRGGYREDDPVGPPRNYYALTKLVAEQVARMARCHLVIRTSFRSRSWPHPVAFGDLYTSQDYVDVIAPDIALAIANCRGIPYEILHIATGRKSAFELARRRRADVGAGTKARANVSLPDDISLDTSRWQRLKAELKER